jgi:hypothetical protein
MVANILWWIAVVFIIFITVMALLELFNRWLPRWFCDHFPYWHIKPKEIRMEGINAKGKCPRCGRDLTSDSQGNWY